MKGHTLLVGRSGIIIYGGIQMPELNMTIADEIQAKKIKFTEAC